MTNTKNEMSKTAIARMEKDLTALLAANNEKKEVVELGQLGAFAEAAVNAGIAGNKGKCDSFAAAHFAGTGTKDNRISEWTKAMEFGDHFAEVKVLTMQMVNAVRAHDGGKATCHIHNTATSVLTMFGKSKKDGTANPDAAAMNVKIADRISKYDANKKKADEKTAANALLSTNRQLVTGIKDVDVVKAIAGLLERLQDGNAHNNVEAAITAVQAIAPKVVEVVKPEPEVVAPIAGEADLAGQLATMQAAISSMAAMMVNK